MNKATEVLDLLEASLVEATKNIVSGAGKKINDQEAKNLIGKVGVRIVFGKEEMDNIMSESNPK